ncbi:MAG: type II secretion system protein [Candidatus Omnitrophica bacterium]|nr:type II secretion system protein [Candidatus Omnitrophota bacterium]
MRHKGFTLVETLVVTVIFAIIGTGIATSFVSGVKIWRRAQDLSKDYNEAILVFEKISKELQQSVDIKEIGFAVNPETQDSGSISGFSFPSIINNKIVKILYRFDENSKALMRSQIDLKDISKDSEKEGLEEKIMDMTSFSVSCLSYDKAKKTFIWSESWKPENGMFLALKITAKYNDKEFTKTIPIPIS